MNMQLSVLLLRALPAANYPAIKSFHPRLSVSETWTYHVETSIQGSDAAWSLVWPTTAGLSTREVRGITQQSCNPSTPSSWAKPPLRYWDSSSRLLTDWFIFLHQSTGSTPKRSRTDGCSIIKSSAHRKSHRSTGQVSSPHWVSQTALPSQADGGTRKGKVLVLQTSPQKILLTLSMLHPRLCFLVPQSTEFLIGKNHQQVRWKTIQQEINLIEPSWEVSGSLEA